MKLLVVGGGGREHAIIKKLKENSAVTEIFATPGNGGIAKDATCVNIGAKDIDAIVNFAKLMIFNDIGWKIALVVSVTMIAAVVFAKVVGSVLPVIAKKIGFDPAVMANPFITTIVDALSLLVYFNMASFLLGI